MPGALVSPERHAFVRAAILACAFLTAPAFAAAPTISGSPPTSVNVGESYWFRPSASDPDGDNLRFSIANKPAWASFSRRTGRLAGTPTASGQHPNVVISVSDGTSRTSLPAFTIAVVAPGATPPPPTISGTPPTSARVGQVYQFRPTASDPSGLPLTFSIANRPTWAGFSTTTGELAGTPGAGDVATFANVVLTASNGTTRSSLPAFSITVQQASMGSASLSWQPPTTRTDGTPLTNLAGYRVHYGTAQGSYPNRVTIANPGVTSTVIENLPPGTYWFVVTAYDANGLESGYSTAASKPVS